MRGSEMMFRLCETGEYDIEMLKISTPHELFEEWCNYEGLHNYADTIIERLRESGYEVREKR